MQAHLRKHLVQGLFLLAIAAAVRSSGLDIGSVALVVVVVVSLGLVELGLRFLHRHDAPAA